MSGCHLSQAGRIHKVVSDVLESIVYERFLHEKHPNISDDLIDLPPDETDTATFESVVVVND